MASQKANNPGVDYRWMASRMQPLLPPLLSGCIIILSVKKKTKNEGSQRIWICVYICLSLICMPESTSQHKANFPAIWEMAARGNEYSWWICFILRGGDTSWTCRRCPATLPPSLSFTAGLSGALETFNVQLDEFNYHLWGGWMDGQMERWMMGREEWEKTHIFPHRVPLSLPLMAAVISHAPAPNGDASERNRAAANRYHDFCSNWSAGLMFV